MPLPERGAGFERHVIESAPPTLMQATIQDMAMIETFYQTTSIEDRYLRYNSLPAKCPVDIAQLRDREGVLLLEFKNAIVGLGEYYTFSESEAELALLARRGFGSFLLRGLLQKTYEAKYSMVMLDINPQNHRMKRFSQRALGPAISKRPGGAGVEYRYSLEAIKQQKPKLFD